MRTADAALEPYRLTCRSAGITLPIERMVFPRSLVLIPDIERRIFVFPTEHIEGGRLKGEPTAFDWCQLTPASGEDPQDVPRAKGQLSVAAKAGHPLIRALAEHLITTAPPCSPSL